MTLQAETEHSARTSADLARYGRWGGLTTRSRYSGTTITQPARDALWEKLLAEVDAHEPGLPEDERQRRAKALLRLQAARAGHASAKARKARRAAQVAR